VAAATTTSVVVNAAATTNATTTSPVDGPPVPALTPASLLASPYGQVNVALKHVSPYNTSLQ